MLVREGGATAAGVGAVVEAGAAVVAAGVCADGFVQPVIKRARRSRPVQVTYRAFILNEEFVRENKHNGSTGRLPSETVPDAVTGIQRKGAWYSILSSMNAGTMCRRPALSLDAYRRNTSNFFKNQMSVICPR